MAGCFVGECPVCEMPVDETDWVEVILEVEGLFVHEWCEQQYIQGKRRTDYIRNLEFENIAMKKLIKKEGLEKRLEEMKFLLK